VSPEVNTPALILDGKLGAVGSDAGTVDHTLRQAAVSRETGAPIDVQRGPAGLTVSVWLSFCSRIAGISRMPWLPTGALLRPESHDLPEIPEPFSAHSCPLCHTCNWNSGQ
jgi:hypothetical protein